MKKLTLFIFSTGIALILTIGCKEDNLDAANNDNSLLVGRWQHDTRLGSINGTISVTFLTDWTIKKEYFQTDNTVVQCAFNPFCGNDFTGVYWFKGDTIFYGGSPPEWRSYYSSWKVEGNILWLEGDMYVQR